MVAVSTILAAAGAVQSILAGSPASAAEPSLVLQQRSDISSPSAAYHSALTHIDSVTKSHRKQKLTNALPWPTVPATKDQPDAATQYEYPPNCDPKCMQLQKAIRHKRLVEWRNVVMNARKARDKFAWSVLPDGGEIGDLSPEDRAKFDRLANTYNKAIPHWQQAYLLHRDIDWTLKGHLDQYAETIEYRVVMQPELAEFKRQFMETIDQVELHKLGLRQLKLEIRPPGNPAPVEEFIKELIQMQLDGQVMIQHPFLKNIEFQVTDGSNDEGALKAISDNSARITATVHREPHVGHPLTVTNTTGPHATDHRSFVGPLIPIISGSRSHKKPTPTRNYTPVQYLTLPTSLHGRLLPLSTTTQSRFPCPFCPDSESKVAVKSLPCNGKIFCDLRSTTQTHASSPTTPCFGYQAPCLTSMPQTARSLSTHIPCRVGSRCSIVISETPSSTHRPSDAENEISDRCVEKCNGDAMCFEKCYPDAIFSGIKGTTTTTTANSTTAHSVGTSVLRRSVNVEGGVGASTTPGLASFLGRCNRRCEDDGTCLRNCLMSESTILMHPATANVTRQHPASSITPRATGSHLDNGPNHDRDDDNNDEDGDDEKDDEKHQGSTALPSEDLFLTLCQEGCGQDISCRRRCVVLFTGTSIATVTSTRTIHVGVNPSLSAVNSDGFTSNSRLATCLDRCMDTFPRNSDKYQWCFRACYTHDLPPRGDSVVIPKQAPEVTVRQHGPVVISKQTPIVTIRQHGPVVISKQTPGATVRQHGPVVNSKTTPSAILEMTQRATVKQHGPVPTSIVGFRRSNINSTVLLSNSDGDHELCLKNCMEPPTNSSIICIEGCYFQKSKLSVPRALFTEQTSAVPSTFVTKTRGSDGVSIHINENKRPLADCISKCSVPVSTDKVAVLGCVHRCYKDVPLLFPPVPVTQIPLPSVQMITAAPTKTKSHPRRRPPPNEYSIDPDNPFSTTEDDPRKNTVLPQPYAAIQKLYDEADWTWYKDPKTWEWAMMPKGVTAEKIRWQAARGCAIQCLSKPVPHIGSDAEKPCFMECVAEWRQQHPNMPENRPRTRPEIHEAAERFCRYTCRIRQIEAILPIPIMFTPPQLVMRCTRICMYYCDREPDDDAVVNPRACFGSGLKINPPQHGYPFHTPGIHTTLQARQTAG